MHATQWCQVFLLLVSGTWSVLALNYGGDYVEEEAGIVYHGHESDLCKMLICECRDHATNATYTRDINVTVDIYCSCANANWRLMYLLSPPPVPPGTRLLHVTACDEVIVQRVDVIPSIARPHILVVIDVPKLSVSEDGFFWANNIVLKNVGLVSVFPKMTLREFPPVPAISSFLMTNVTIEKVEKGAFGHINVIYNFELNNVKINNMEEESFIIRLLSRTGEFKMTDTRMETMPRFGIMIQASYVTLQNCTFNYIESHGLSVFSEHFLLANSSVLSYVKKLAFDVQSIYVVFVDNVFNTLDSLALFAVRKLDQRDRNDHFLALTNNRIQHALPGSLNPNWTLNNDRDIVHDNVFEDCTCASMQWLWHALHGKVPNETRNFYKILVTASVCKIDECRIPLFHVIQMFEPTTYDLREHSCSDSYNYADLCNESYYLSFALKSHSFSCYTIAVVFSILCII